MNKVPFARVYRRILNETLNPLGFQGDGANFVRVLKSGVLHVVVLHKSNPWTFTGDFAVQPLVYPEIGIFLDFGDRVDNVDPARKSWWDLPEDSEGVELVVKSYAQTVVSQIVPWLNRFQSYEDLVRVDLSKRWGIDRLDAPVTSKHAVILGLCALAAELLKDSKTYLEFARGEYRRLLSADSPDWFRRELFLVEDYLTLLDAGDCNSIRRKLGEGEAYTRKSLGLPPKG